MAGPRDRIQFRRSDYAFADSKRRVPTVDVVINGRSLYDLINGGDPELVGNGVPGRMPKAVAPPSTAWTGGTDGTEFHDGRTLVIDCECGTSDCGGTFARITVRDADVVWEEVGRTYDKSFGPFRFERRQYEDALRQIEDA